MSDLVTSSGVVVDYNPVRDTVVATRRLKHKQTLSFLGHCNMSDSKKDPETKNVPYFQVTEQH